MDNLIEFEVKFEYFDYYFTKKHQTKYDYIKAKSIDEARTLCYWKHGDSIDLLSIEEF